MEELTRHGIKGSLLISPEGINGTIAGTRAGVDAFLSYLKTEITKEHVEHKESLCDHQPFKRTKVRLKKETISLGEAADPNAPGGQHVEPREWNALIADPDTIVLDARNAYEVHLGTFEGAIDPDTRNFKQLPEFIRHRLGDAKGKKIATFCTGGIRCEKLTPWMRAQGFEQVYQLKGGILKYLEEIPESESAWHGECFVFDERVAVGHGLATSKEASMCRACGHPLTQTDRMHADYAEGKACGFCARKT